MPNRVVTTPVTELDFFAIKENLKTYLSGTSEFSDFDYEGSGINILLDLLAYNTHYTAVYANMLAAESFIDSAVMRRSLVSLGKNLGYVPNSSTAATAVLNLTMGTTSGVPNYIPIGTKFFSSKDGDNYTFSTVDSFKVNKDAVPYKVSNLEVRQGIYKTASYIYDSTINAIRFEIPSAKIDKSLIKIYVMNSPTDLSNMDESWKVNDDYLQLDSTSKVFFINENFRGNYEISFGDGILGSKPADKSYIMIVYFQTEGSAGNAIGNSDTDAASSFTFNGIGGNDFDASVDTVTASYGGAERDTEEQIRYTAPKYYQSQDRAVTISDYESIILKEYSAASAVRVWGGEENDPPVYGKVFVSILPKSGEILSDAAKESIKTNILSKKKVIAVTPELVDPDYTYIKVNCFVTYDSSRTTQSDIRVGSSASATIVNYSNTSLEKFNGSFRYSVLTRLVDLSNTAMVSNRISTKLAKKLIPRETPTSFILDFGAKLNHPFDGNNTILNSSVFKYKDTSTNLLVDCFLEDDGYGSISIYTIKDGSKVVLKSGIGSVDYQTGKVNLVNFNPYSSNKLSYIEISVEPDQRFDIVPKRNQILKIDENISGSIVVDTVDVSRGNI
jgi:hypothetical protein